MLEGPMYAVGGHDGWSYLNTVERWDPQARQWNYVASMSTPRSTVGVAALNSKYGSRKTSLWVFVCFLPRKYSFLNFLFRLMVINDLKETKRKYKAQTSERKAFLVLCGELISNLHSGFKHVSALLSYSNVKMLLHAHQNFT